MTPSLAPLVEPLGDSADPADICARFLDLPYLLFLDSSTAQQARFSGASGLSGEIHPLEQFSFLAADPMRLVRSKGTHTEVWERDGQWAHTPGDALGVARGFLPESPSEPVPGLPPFQGGVAGYIGYDWGAVLERLPRPRYDDLAIHDVVLGLYDWVIAWDHRIGTAWLISTGLPETESGRGGSSSSSDADGSRATRPNGGRQRRSTEAGSRRGSSPPGSYLWSDGERRGRQDRASLYFHPADVSGCSRAGCASTSWRATSFRLTFPSVRGSADGSPFRSLPQASPAQPGPFLGIPGIRRPRRLERLARTISPPR